MNQYHFGVLNRLEKAVNHQTGEASSYQYNGLGDRVGRTIGNPIGPKLPTDKLQSLTIRPTKQTKDTIDYVKKIQEKYNWEKAIFQATQSYYI